MEDEVSDISFRDGQYLYLVAANIGAVIMPWMVFFQQSAAVEKKLTMADLQAGGRPVPVTLRRPKKVMPSWHRRMPGQTDRSFPVIPPLSFDETGLCAY